jgi:transposase InsO family protein
MPTSSDQQMRIELFADQDHVSEQEVIGLWTSEGGLSREEARRRLAELLLVATAPDGQLAGIATTYLKRHDQLRGELWHYRTLVAQAHRQTHLALAMALRARHHLVRRFTSGEDQRGLGIIFEIENEILKRFEPKAVWPRTGFVFIGENARGAHVRVYYFPGALAPEPS